MRKGLFLLLALLAMCSSRVSAQNYALIDMEYILENIPEYQNATKQIEAASRQWQAEVEKLSKEAQTLYQSYQKRVSTLSDSQRSAQEEAVIAKEKQASDLRRKYFGPEGELYKKQSTLIQPIEDRIYEAVKRLAQRYNYAMVIDRSSAQSVIYASPDIDISNDVLRTLGYSN